MTKGFSILLFSIVMLLLLCGIGFGIYNYYITFQYERVIGSYMLNAKDMNTPDKMLEQLQLAKQGMINEGLVDSDYGALIFKKPDNSMKFQYEHIDSIIERVKAVQEWKDKTYGNESNTQTENMGDVYETKMTNLRNFIMEDVRSDWIAKDAWMIKNHFIVYLKGIIGVTLAILIMLFIFIGGATWDS